MSKGRSDPSKREHSPFSGSHNGTAMMSTRDDEPGPTTRVEFRLQTNQDIMGLLAELLSSQYAFFAEVSKDWFNAWGKLPKTTQAITADTTRAQLQWAYDSGLKPSLTEGRVICKRIAEHCSVEILQDAYSNGLCGLHVDACSSAAARDDLEMIQWACQQKRCDWHEVLCSAAAAGGSLRILQWARDQNFPWSFDTCSSAAGHGHLHILEWARSKRCPWNSKTCSEAAGGGHLGVLKWARARCCRWDGETCDKAARMGHLEVLQWARANGAVWGYTTTWSAACGGHLHLLEWALAQGCPWDSQECSAVAIEKGHLCLLRWMIARGHSLDTHAMNTAAMLGRQDVLECIYSSSHDWNNSGTCEFAAMGGQLRVLQWARNIDCPWDSRVCSTAAWFGLLEVLKWARCNGCPWDAQTCASAARGGHLEVLKWARRNGCPWGEHTCASAAKGGHLDVIKWARAQGCPWDGYTCTVADRFGHRHVKIWATTHGCPQGVRERDGYIVRCSNSLGAMCRNKCCAAGCHHAPCAFLRGVLALTELTILIAACLPLCISEDAMLAVVALLGGLGAVWFGRGGRREL